MTGKETTDFRREMAIEALRKYGETNKAMGPSRTYLVHDAYQNGETNIRRLAALAGVSRGTIYSDLATYGVEVAEDLSARLACWTEDVDSAGLVSEPDSDYNGFAAHSYRRVWRKNLDDGGYKEIELLVWVDEFSGSARYGGAWTCTIYANGGNFIASDRVPVTAKLSSPDKAIRAGLDAGLGIEKAINSAVISHAQTMTLTDLHAAYRPQWI